MSKRISETMLLLDEHDKTPTQIPEGFSQNGYKVLQSKSSEEVLDLTNDLIPDIVFIEMCTAEKNDFELCRVISESRKTLHIPIIILCTDTCSEKKIRALESGCVDYICEPFSMPELIARTKVHIKLKSSRLECQKANMQLVKQIRDRKKLEKELRLAKEIAEASTKSKSDFLASMSHEIRTPMNGIIGTGSLLKSTNLDETQRDYMDIIDYSANNLLTIINDILDISKIEAGQITLEIIDFNLHNIIDETIKLLMPKAREKGITYTAHIDNTVPMYAKGDPIRLKQIIINLANNAIKFTDKGSVGLEVKTIDIDQVNRKYLFRVIDTGIGIQKGAKERIFAEYLQADSATTRIFGGTGLGLPIAKKLVEIMGGEIGYESIVGDGSTFWFTAVLSIGKEPPYSLEDNDAIRSDDKDKYSILIAEDNLINQKVVIATLKKMGHRLEIADDGKIAFEMHKKNHYDVILMDIQMPVMDGFESTRLIREWEKQMGFIEPVNIIAMTANAMKQDREKCLSSGMDYYISKPFKASELSKMLDDIFAR